MDFGGINYIAVVIAAVASFAFGAGWYGFLSKPWMAAAGMSEDDIKSPDGSRKPMHMTFVIAGAAQLIMAYMLAGLIMHLGEVTIARSMLTGAAAWFGFVVTTMVVNNGFQMKPFALSLIDGGHWLCVLLIQSAIIGAFGA